MHPFATAYPTSPHGYISLPSIFQDGSNATMDINGFLQKGYIKRQSDNTYQFSVRRGSRSHTELLGFPLHEFKQHWDKMMMEENLFPGHTMVSYLLRPPRSPHQPRALFFSARYSLSRPDRKSVV